MVITRPIAVSRIDIIKKLTLLFFFQYDVKPNKRFQLASDDSSLQSILAASKELTIKQGDTLNDQVKDSNRIQFTGKNSEDNSAEFVVLPVSRKDKNIAEV